MARELTNEDQRYIATMLERARVAMAEIEHYS